jgi:hypothetical protein
MRIVRLQYKPAVQAIVPSHIIVTRPATEPLPWCDSTPISQNHQMTAAMHNRSSVLAIEVMPVLLPMQKPEEIPVAPAKPVSRPATEPLPWCDSSPITQNHQMTLAKHSSGSQKAVAIMSVLPPLQKPEGSPVAPPKPVPRPAAEPLPWCDYCPISQNHQKTLAKHSRGSQKAVRVSSSLSTDIAVPTECTIPGLIGVQILL